jgi:hypothetical protein
LSVDVSGWQVFGRAPQSSRRAPRDQQRTFSGPGGPESARRKLLIDHSIGTSRSGELESLRLRLDLLNCVRAGGNAAPLHENHGNHGRHGNHARGDGNPWLRFAKTVARRSGSFGAFLPASLEWSDGASPRGRCQDSTGATRATDARIEGSRVRCCQLGLGSIAHYLSSDKLSARSFALIRETAHLGRNSVRLCGFRRASPTIGTAILDISYCCHTSLGVSAGQSIQPDKTPLLSTDSRVTACRQDIRPDR